MAMTDDEIRRSIALGLDWSVQEFAAYMNAANWLQQSARGEVPSGNAYQPTGECPCPPAPASPAPENGETAPLIHKTASPSVTSTEDQP